MTSEGSVENDASPRDAPAAERIEDRLSENALEVFRRRYVRRGPDGEPVETVEGAFRRVASHIAAAEESLDGNCPEAEEVFFDLMSELRFLPNSPTFTGAGTPLSQLAACFVLPISDDMGRRSDGIFETLRDMALIQQTGGGTGFSFSRLRPKGAVVHSSGGRATGPVGFMQVYDTASEIISQGGARRGANMAVLNINHPDIRQFIHCKSNEYAITNFNISVGVSDEFMRALSEDSVIDLINPQDGETWETVPARELFEEIVEAAYRNGEPGLLFLDTANRDNPTPHLGHYEATNPCGEQPLLPYENCCLGSINLAWHVHRDDDGVANIDWEGLATTVRQSVRFLDDVIDANGYVPAVPELAEAARRSRRIGLGITGLGDVLYRLRVRYGSEESRELAGQLMAFIRCHAMRASVDLARRRGPFPAITGSIYDPQHLCWEPPQPVEPFTRLDRWGRPPLDWEALVAGIERHGIRNAAQTTIAPTGTRSTIAGIEAYGCEPVFALAYVRHMKDNGEDVELRYSSPLFREALEEAGLDEATRERIVEQVAISGSCQDVEEVPEEIRRVFVVAQDIPAEEHVRMQAALQAFVDASISKTINFPADAVLDDVAEAFQLAWELSCKGLTVYVTGSRDKVVLETEETRQAKKLEERTMGATKVRPRPHSLVGQTYRVRTPLGTAYTTVNVNGENEPFEVFLNVGKAGSDTAAVAEAIGRLISLVLRIPSPLSSTKRLNQVVRQLKGIGGGRSLGFGRDRVRSLPDGVAQVLAEHLGLSDSLEAPRGTEQLPLFPEGDLCPECGQATLVFEEGCRHCYACGYSEC
ncbi:MAG: adenosylcobalamin-dependent ribonucleoside-diphosphate reductase [Chloroflexota bacterium]|nr:adenosylcobalamin-dependent ribonucleoside-diphosphate reductase [Chloroflexota bacterium]